MLFQVTYETITPESAEHGDAETRGFYAEDVTSLRDALEYLGHGADGIEANEYPVSDPSWITAYRVNDGTRDYYEKAITENRSLHFPDDMTPSSKLRVCRLLGVYGV